MDDRCIYDELYKEPFRCDLRETTVEGDYCRDRCRLFYRRNLFRDMKAGAWRYIKIIDSDEDVVPTNLTIDLAGLLNEPVNEGVITAFAHALSSYHNTAEYLVAMPEIGQVTRAYADLTNKKFRQLKITADQISLDKGIKPDKLTAIVAGYVNTGNTMLRAVEYLRQKNVYFHSTYALIDAENGGWDLLEKNHCWLMSLMTMKELLD